MKTEKCKIAILTKSNKALPDGGYGCCVAGVTATGEWIRLVSSQNGDAIPKDKAAPIPLIGVIEAEFVRTPLLHQIENAILLHYTITKESPRPFIQSIPPVTEKGIFGNFERMLSPFEVAQAVGTLRLIDVTELTTYRRLGEGCKAAFVYHGNQCIDFAMTAPNGYAASGTERRFGNATIVVSLPEHAPYIKFVAAIYPHK